MELNELKKEYNKKLARNKKAEEYFRTHSVADCMKYLKLFNQVTEDLGALMIQFRNLTGRNMTHKEATEGFREVQ